MTIVGSDKYTYELIQDWPKLPSGEALGVVSTVATDSKDRVYAFQRQDPPVMVFDRDGNYLNRWGIGAITDPHGMTIVDDIVYITDRSDHVAVKFTLDGKPPAGNRRPRSLFGYWLRISGRSGASGRWPVQLLYGDGAQPHR